VPRGVTWTAQHTYFIGGVQQFALCGPDSQGGKGEIAPQRDFLEEKEKKKKEK
jgi:hypothetical protein